MNEPDETGTDEDEPVVYDDPFDDPELARQQMDRKRRGRQAAGGVIGAAMLAVGDILEPDKAEVAIEQAAEPQSDDPLAGLDFGNLPPLD